MSPASSGPLQVERYIGACLISSHHHNHARAKHNNNQQQQPATARRCATADGWAGGVPLISFANNQRRHQQHPEDVQLSRLAVHTQGLPLILSRAHHHPASRRPHHPRTAASHPPRNIIHHPVNKKESSNAVDTLSVASDESSSSNHSETSLPRIIKPRKRRKKDRKPHPVRAQDHTEPPLNRQNSSNIVTLKPYVPYCYERRERSFPPKNNTEDTKKVLDETPQLLHRFEDVDASGDADEPSMCQCRVCDPAGHIWDVERHGYSPFLTNPSTITPPYRQLQHSLSDPTGYHDPISAALQISALSCEDTLPNRTQQCLQISTKIVTSPNGHRDLEIRLFSTFPIDDDRPKDKTDDNNKASEICVNNNKCESVLTPEE